MAIDSKGFQRLRWYYQVLIVSAICAGLLTLLWYQFLTPIVTDINAKGIQLQELQRVNAKGREQERVQAQLKKESDGLQAKLDKLKSVLPLAKETDEVLRSVQRAATSSSLRILRVGSRPIIDHEVYTEWPIDMDLLGTYHNVGAFLDKIRLLPRIVNIAGLRLQSKASTGDAAFTSSVGATYTATTFVYREEPVETTAPPPKPVK